MEVDVDERIRRVLHNPGGIRQMCRKTFEESFGVLKEGS